MSCNGLGECCGQEVNVFAYFDHSYWRHRPFILYELNESLGLIVPDPPNPGQAVGAEAEACQDGYLTLTKVTTYAHSVNGTRTRTQVWGNNPFTGALTPIDSSTGDTTEYPVNEAGWPVDWDYDFDAMPNIAVLVDSTATHFKFIWYLMLVSDNSVKLTLTVEVTLSESSTYAGFVQRCRDLYAVTFERMLDDSEGAGGGNGWIGLWYLFDDAGYIVDTPNDVWIGYDAYWTIEATWFSALKSIRLPDVTIYESGSTIVHPRVANPVVGGNTYKLTETVYTPTCEPPFLTYPLVTCDNLGVAGTFQVSAPEFGQSLVEPGTCPP